jgi:hypothetical protein
MNDDSSNTVHEDDEVESELEDMDEEDFETFLADAISDYAEENDAPRTRTRTFGEAGVLTNNKGLVVRVGDAEFQVTIVRSR